METIIYYTWTLTILLLLVLFSLSLIAFILYIFEELLRKTRFFAVFYYKYSKMNYKERILIDHIYKSLMWNKEILDKYFKD